VAALMDNQGSPVTYKDPEADDLSATAIVSQESREQSLSGSGVHQGWVKTRTVTLARDAASPYGGVPVPRVGAVVEITRGTVVEEWKVSAVESMSEHFVTLKVVRPTDREVAAKSYRGN